MRRASGIPWGLIAVVAVAGSTACVPGMPLFGTLPTTPRMAVAVNGRADEDAALVGGVARTQDVVAPSIDPIAQMPSAFDNGGEEAQGQCLRGVAGSSDKLPPDITTASASTVHAP